MKRILIFVLALMLCAGAFADMTPSIFMSGRGLMVLDTNQLADMGVDMSGFNTEIDATMAIYLFDDPTFGNLILWYEDGVAYVTVDLSALLGHGMASTKKGISQVFIDFCKTFDFDICVFSGNDVTYYHPSNLKGYDIAQRLKNSHDEMHLCFTQKGFFDELKKAVS